MYKYYTNISIDDSIENTRPLCFQIILKDNIYFEIGECYFTIKKNHDHNYIISDEISIYCFLAKDDIKKATEKISRALDFFIYLTGLPFYTEFTIFQTNSNTIPIVDVNKSPQKIAKLKIYNKSFNKVNKKRPLLDNMLHLYSSAIKFHYLFDIKNCGDAFFIFFKILENISIDDFSINYKSKNKRNLISINSINKILYKHYKIKIPAIKATELSSFLSNQLFEKVSNEIFYKILLFFSHYKIDVDTVLISQIVTIRNKIAHGDSIQFEDYQKEYSYLQKLCNKAISLKFFSGLDPKLNSHIKVI